MTHLVALTDCSNTCISDSLNPLLLFAFATTREKVLISTLETCLTERCFAFFSVYWRVCMPSGIHRTLYPLFFLLILPLTAQAADLPLRADLFTIRHRRRRARCPTSGRCSARGYSVRPVAPINVSATSTGLTSASRYGARTHSRATGRPMSRIISRAITSRSCIRS